MAWPPDSLVVLFTDETDQDDVHAPHHVAIGQALDDLVAFLGDATSGGTHASIAARFTALEDAIEELQQFVTQSLSAHVEASNPHPQYWLSPDGGDNIWTRDTDPGGLASEDDIWVRPVS